MSGPEPNEPLTDPEPDPRGGIGHGSNLNVTPVGSVKQTVTAEELLSQLEAERKKAEASRRRIDRTFALFNDFSDWLGDILAWSSAFDDSITQDSVDDGRLDATDITPAVERLNELEERGNEIAERITAWLNDKDAQDDVDAP